MLVEIVVLVVTRPVWLPPKLLAHACRSLGPTVCVSVLAATTFSLDVDDVDGHLVVGGGDRYYLSWWIIDMEAQSTLSKSLGNIKPINGRPLSARLTLSKALQ